jgi:hypothetical protein
VDYGLQNGNLDKDERYTSYGPIDQKIDPSFRVNIIMPQQKKFQNNTSLSVRETLSLHNPRYVVEPCEMMM